MPLNFLLWVFVVALRKRYGCVVTALLLHCSCAVQEACCWNIPYMRQFEKTLGGIWRCSTPKKASEEGIFARKGGLYAIYLHKDFAAVQINCTFAADFTN